MNSRSSPPFVTVVIPCRNEEQHIRKVLGLLFEQDHPKERLEVFVVDGMSEDATPRIVEEMAQEGNLRLFTNPERTVPFALNKAVSEARGDFVIRMDAHSQYPRDYISTLVRMAEELDADNIGGAWDTKPAGSGGWARAIAAVTSHPLGIGNADYRNKEGGKAIETDTVPFGCFRKETFDRIGRFDVELTRNQDDEFNGRLIDNGGRIFLIPSLRITYYGRDSLKGMLWQFFQYGWYKPLVNKKLKKPATLRQFAPPLMVFCSFSILILILGPFWKVGVWALITGGGLYIAAGMKILKDRSEKLNIKGALLVPVTLFLLHLSYGSGYWGGVFRWLLHDGEHKE